MATFDSDKAMNVLGVDGRLTHRTTKEGQAPGLWFRQSWISEARPIAGYGPGAMIRAEMRFDDDPSNGHNCFAITGDVFNPTAKRRQDRVIAGGCLHDDIARVFPELAPLIKWHLVSTDGPMHYVENTVYHAGNRDYNGKLKGEPRSFETFLQFGANPIKHKLGGKFAKFLQEAAAHPGRDRFDFEVLAYEHDDRGKPGKYQFGPKYTFGGFADKWHECPFDDESRALDFLKALQTCEPQFVSIATAWGEGKARELDHARSSAVWPEATDEQLSVEPAALRAALEARLPKLIADFREAMNGAGFFWSPEEFRA